MSVRISRIVQAIVPISAALMSGLGASSARADLVLQYSPTATTTINYTGGVVATSNTPVNVTIDVPNSAGPNPVAATLSYSASTTGSAGQFFGGLLDDSAVNNVSFSLTADSPVNGHTNILSGTASAGDFNGTSAGFSLNGQNQTFNDGITFSSDFIDTGQLTNYAFQFLISNPDPFPDVNAGVMDDFSGDVGTGSFTADAVPEPASLALLSVGAIPLLRRKRRR